jgi:hypothetical protein
MGGAVLGQRKTQAGVHQSGGLPGARAGSGRPALAGDRAGPP